MTKTEFMDGLNLDTATDSVKEEMMSLLNTLPEELTEENMASIAAYSVAAQAREQDLAMAANEAADVLDKYADEVDQIEEEEDATVAKILRDNLEAAQNLVGQE